MIGFQDFLRGRSKRRETRRDKRNQHQEVDFDKLIMISENVASGMAELVRLGVVHRDLAARNVMIDQWLQASTFAYAFSPMHYIEIKLHRLVCNECNHIYLTSGKGRRLWASKRRSRIPDGNGRRFWKY